ncbi:hypothetical protein [Terrabacter sp. NPDC080008]|uniref:hypothetical protein n=1 Tax=Terrabacter sp. NPDC080008 TaxID=3155176 RepID=UPI00344D291A
MPINHIAFTIGNATAGAAAEIRQVAAIAEALLAELRRISDDIDRIHRWRAKSDDIQATFFGWLEQSYKVSIEKTEGFEDTTTRHNRPDAQIWLDSLGTRRVLVEVERGGTVTNGHDLKDMWKAHLSPLVQHLFLVVPNTIEAEDGTLRSDQAFLRCSARLGSFFQNSRTEVDVLSVHLFGYGANPVPRRTSPRTGAAGIAQA